MIDLHCHSSFSDGALTPHELIEKAKANQLTVLSLTDHDTVAGYKQLREAAAHSGIKIIQGIELSTRWKKHDIHILGYQIEHNETLQQLIQKQNQSRIDRAQAIGQSLQSIGIVDAYQKACDIAGHDRVGRPHFARLIVDEGHARDMQSAFKQYLVRGRASYIPTSWIGVDEAISGIIACNGHAVLAHPQKYGLTRTKVQELIQDFKSFGGHGIEVVSGEMTVSEVRDMAGLANRFDLWASSGSDFHSDAGSRINLGRQQQLPVQCKAIWEQWNI